MKILVTGGAGYIGSVAVKKLCDFSHSVVVLDNLSKGIRSLVDKRAEFIQGDLTDKERLDQLFSSHKFDVVMHFSAYKAVEESMTDAVKYSDNISGMICLLNSMVKHNVKKIIFSSSAAVYGMPDREVIDETCPLQPINFYGYTKVAMEKCIRWYNRIHGISYVAFRYFNVAGDLIGYIDPDAKNIFPIIMEVITKKRDGLTVFGEDYPTRDGTCVRDYIDVEDLVDAHILAINTSYEGSINIGTGHGYTVKELIGAFKKVTGIDFPVIVGERRSGDPPALIASNNLAKDKLGWKPKHNIEHMIKKTFDAYGL